MHQYFAVKWSEQGLMKYLKFGISAGSMYAAGNMADGLRIIENPIIPHQNGMKLMKLPNDEDEIRLADGQAVYIADASIKII